jgi:hypothetical protein
VAVEISNEPAVSALGLTAERDGWGQFIVAVGSIHTAVSFPDSHAAMQQRRDVRFAARRAAADRAKQQ